VYINDDSIHINLPIYILSSFISPSNEVSSFDMHPSNVCFTHNWCTTFYWQIFTDTCKRQPKERRRIDNLEKEITERTMKNWQSRDTDNIGQKTQNETQKTNKMKNTNLAINHLWTQVLAKGKQFLLLVRHPVMLLIVKFGKHVVGDRGKKTIT
jgi:hypothetical protein